MKDVFFVVNIVPPRGGGASIYTKQIINILKESDKYNPKVITTYDDEQIVDYYNDVPVYHLATNNSEVITEYGTPIQFIEEEVGIRPDIMHIHPCIQGLKSIFNSLRAYECGFVYEARGPKLPYSNMKYGVDKAYLSINQDMDSQLVSDLDIDNEQIFRSPVAVDATYDSEPVTDTSDKFKCLFVGTVHKHKGPHIALEAVNQVDGAELFIVGKGDMSSVISKRASEIDDVTYVGNLEHDKTLAEIDDADLLVAPFSYEGEPRVIYEAIRQNTPIVASEAGKIKQMISGRGVLSGRTVEDFKQSINFIINNYSEYKNKLEQNRLEGHSIDEVRNGVFKSYEYVV
jgi:glycosyltransferase involved in cell wall biosynthesis